MLLKNSSKKEQYKLVNLIKIEKENWPFGKMAFGKLIGNDLYPSFVWDQNPMGLADLS